MTSGLDIGLAAQDIIHRTLTESNGDGTLAELEQRLSHIDGSRSELKTAIAYLAAQVYAYRSMQNEDAALALGQIRATLSAFESRQASIHSDPAKEES